MSRTLLLFLVLLLGACVSAQSRDWRYVQGIEWRLAELEGRSALEDVEVTLRLEGDRQIVGLGGVNRYFGSFAREGRRFAIAGVASTRMAGPRHSLEQERLYLALLERVDGFLVEEGRLTLLEGDRAVLGFRPAR